MPLSISSSQNPFAKIRWKHLILHAIVWIVVELFLGWVGLDDLADYGEFVFRETRIAVGVSIACTSTNGDRALV